MKKILVGITAILISAGAYAQTDQKHRNASDTVGYQKSNRQHPDGYMLVNGKMMYVKDNKMTLLKNDTTLTDGTIVMRDGNFIKSGGSKTMLKEGQHMDNKGKIIYVSNNRDNKFDGNKKYGNASDTVAQQKSNSQQPDGYTMLNGQMMCVKDNKMTLLKKDTTLTDGTIVRRDGNFIKKGGTRTMLKEGQHIDLKGKIVYVSDNRDNKLDGKKKMYLVKDTTSNRKKQK